MLRIEKENKLFFDGEPVNVSSLDFKEFMIANLGVETTLGPDVTLEDVIHSFYGLREFIYQYFSEEYEVVRAFLTVSKFTKRYSGLRIHKIWSIEEGYLYLVPNVELVESAQDNIGTDRVSKLRLYLDNNVELEHDNTKTKAKVKFTLLDVLSAVFEELSFILKNNDVISPV